MSRGDRGDDLPPDWKNIDIKTLFEDPPSESLASSIYFSTGSGAGVDSASADLNDDVFTAPEPASFLASTRRESVDTCLNSGLYYGLCSPGLETNLRLRFPGLCELDNSANGPGLETDLSLRSHGLNCVIYPGLETNLGLCSSGLCDLDNSANGPGPETDLSLCSPGLRNLVICPGQRPTSDTTAPASEASLTASTAPAPVEREYCDNC